MAYNFKKINDVPVVEAMKNDLNVFVEDGGKMAKIPANKMIPEDVALKSDIPTKVSELENDSVIPVPMTAEVGQVVAVKAVDENGKPTEWEAVEISLSPITFYINNSYLYHFDTINGLGEKVTIEEYANIVGKNMIYITNGNSLSLPKSFHLENGYGYIITHDEEYFYTAEWVDSGPR